MKRPIALLLCAATLVIAGCATTQKTAQQKQPYTTSTPTGSNLIKRQSKGVTSDATTEARTNKVMDEWGKETDRLLVQAINESKGGPN